MKGGGPEIFGCLSEKGSKHQPHARARLAKRCPGPHSQSRSTFQASLFISCDLRKPLERERWHVLLQPSMNTANHHANFTFS